VRFRADLARWSDNVLVDKYPRAGAWLFDLVGANQEPEMALLSGLCLVDRISIDVGAKVGAYVRQLLPVSAHVHAFEPNPRTASFLRRTADTRTTVHQMALGAGQGSADLRIPHDAGGRTLSGRATIAPGNNLAGLATTLVTVQCQSLDALASAGIFGVTPVGFIKIDVEGHEHAVIAGAMALLARDRPNLLIESNAEHGGDIKRLRTDLAALGYACFALAGGDLRRLSSSDVLPSENAIFMPS
jgi:FkbM family methyltransferase